MKYVLGLCICLGLLLATAIDGQAAPSGKKAKQGSGGTGTVFFMRPMPVLGWATRPDIKLDGRQIGEIGVGTYFVVNVPRGRHMISVQGGLIASPYESELNVEAGKTYFIEIGPAGQMAPGSELITRAISGNTWGQRMPGRGFNAAYSFFLLDPAEGRRRLASLKKAGGR